MRLRGVGKRFDRQTWVFTGVDLDVPSGERVAVRGGNGSGKSTLLRIMVGVTRPSTGRVEQRPREIGYVPDRFPPDERMSARSYLVHMGRIRGLGTRAAERRADELIERLRLVGADSAMRALSQGNARKVALAQALLLPPRLLVMDEPWSGLDSSAHGTLGEILDDTASAGAAVVFTEHDESVLRAHADRVHTVTDGLVTRDDVWSAPPRRTRLVLRRPTSGAHRLDAAEWLAREGIASAAVEGDRIVLLVAEEHTDGLALSALRDGWSLVSAGRADADEVVPEGDAP